MTYAYLNEYAFNAATHFFIMGISPGIVNSSLVDSREKSLLIFVLSFYAVLAVENQNSKIKTADRVYGRQY